MEKRGKHRATGAEKASQNKRQRSTLAPISGKDSERMTQRKSGVKLVQQPAEGLHRWLTGNRERERGGNSERERVMVTFIPSRDHQKRAS